MRVGFGEPGGVGLGGIMPVYAGIRHGNGKTPNRTFRCTNSKTDRQTDIDR